MRNIGRAVNYYGGVVVQIVDGKYYWIIEDFSGLDDALVDDEGDTSWEEIPKSLYEELIKFSESLKNA